MARACGPNVASAHNPGVFLGGVLGAAAAAGRDKITFVADPAWEPFPDWIEQLIAESSGKLGLGLFPIVGEPPGPPESYGPDRLMVYLRSDGALDRKARDWIEAGIPVVILEMGPGPSGAGAEFFRWEVATAIACHLLGVHAFDQPDVQRAKERASGALRGRKSGLPAAEEAWKGNGLHVWAHHLFPADTSLRGVWETIVSQVGSRDTVALLAYLAPSPSTTKGLTRWRRLIREHLGRPTMLGYGPRYLHSTGQLFKGGPDRLVAIYLLGPSDPDLPVPGESFTLGELLRAQAVGDFEAMHGLGRKTYAFVLDTLQRLADVEASLVEVLESASGPQLPG
jgi:transaldolase/glucose-6-phosphate isomerase